MKVLLVFLISALEACGKKPSWLPKPKSCSSLKLKCPGVSGKYAYVSRTRKGLFCHVKSWNDIEREDSRNAIDRYCKNSSPLKKCWNHILPSKKRPCSIPTSPEDLEQVFGRDTNVCNHNIRAAIGRVLHEFNEEIIIKRCKLHPSCLIHDRCFTMVDNNLIKGGSYGRCNTEQKTVMLSIARQRRTENLLNAGCLDVAEVIHAILNLVPENGCKDIDCFTHQFADFWTSGSFLRVRSSLKMADWVIKLIIAEFGVIEFLDWFSNPSEKANDALKCFTGALSLWGREIEKDDTKCHE